MIKDVKIAFEKAPWGSDYVMLGITLKSIFASNPLEAEGRCLSRNSVD